MPRVIRIRSFQSGDEAAFRSLNEEWIAAFFGIEEKDRIVLSDPVRNILQPGGHIFMALAADKPVACCALLALGPGMFEVAKMSVTPSLRGCGIGRKLIEHTISQARALGASRLCLETNSKLLNAIHLYESVGFRHIPAERVVPSAYARANVYMEMFL